MNPTRLTERAAATAARIAVRRTTVTLWLQPVDTSEPSPDEPDFTNGGGSDLPNPSEHVLGSAYVTPMDAQEIDQQPHGSFAQGGFRVTFPIGTTDQDDRIYGDLFPNGPINGRERFVVDLDDQVEFTYADGGVEVLGRVVGDEPQDIMGGWYGFNVEVNSRGEPT